MTKEKMVEFFKANYCDIEAHPLPNMVGELPPAERLLTKKQYDKLVAQGVEIFGEGFEKFVMNNHGAGTVKERGKKSRRFWLDLQTWDEAFSFLKRILNPVNDVRADVPLEIAKRIIFTVVKLGKKKPYYYFVCLRIGNDGEASELDHDGRLAVLGAIHGMWLAEYVDGVYGTPDGEAVENRFLSAGFTKVDGADERVRDLADYARRDLGYRRF